MTPGAHLGWMLIFGANTTTPPIVPAIAGTIFEMGDTGCRDMQARIAQAYPGLPTQCGGPNETPQAELLQTEAAASHDLAVCAGAANSAPLTSQVRQAIAVCLARRGWWKP